MRTLINKTMVTLNIEASDVRFLSFKGKRIEAWGNAPLIPGSIRDTQIANQEAVVSVLNDLFSSARLPRSEVIVSLTGMRSISRIATLPRIKRGQMSEAVRWAASREMPMPLEELQVSWDTIDNRGEERSIFLLGTPRALLDPFYQALSKAGIKPRAIDLKPLALIRMVNRTEAIIIDLENDSTSVVILAQGIPEVMHTIIVQQRGTILEDRVLGLAEDLSRIMRFYGISYPEHPLDITTPVFLTGEMADNPGVVELVRENIGYPIEQPSLYLECPPGLSIPHYAVNLGLALREMAPGRRDKSTPGTPSPINVNILPTV